MLSWEMQLILFDGENVCHSLPSCRFALFSSIMQLFPDWVLLSPAVAARSSLQVRAMSKAGTLSATVTTSCELNAIIEMEMGISRAPVLSGSTQGLRLNGRPRAKANLQWQLSLSSHRFDFLYGIRAAGRSCGFVRQQACGNSTLTRQYLSAHAIY